MRSCRLVRSALRCVKEVREARATAGPPRFWSTGKTARRIGIVTESLGRCFVKDKRSQLGSVGQGVEEIRTLAGELLPQTECLIARLQRFRGILERAMAPSPCETCDKEACDKACGRLEAPLNGPREGKPSGATTMGVHCDDIAVCRGRRGHVGSGEWLSLANAARIAEVHRGTIARLANAGKLVENREKGHKRRVLKASVLRWMGERVENQRMREFTKYERDIERIPERH